MSGAAKGPSVKQTAWHEAGHAVVAWYHGLEVVLVSIRPSGAELGRSQHRPAGNPAIAEERWREFSVAMGGWAAELHSGEASDATYDDGDLQWVLTQIEAHAPDRLAAELGTAEREAERIVSMNLDRVERLANELIRREQLSDSSEIRAIIEGGNA
ncbi:hypothetical protein HL667_10250 [Bradyrhizobium sp. 83012]|uniref:Peptidase M41 domain-containing protein n=1 Tax=Bradyrhizobium aeschynomenes TaxID=2734909 RepID=A0ABX2CAV5_9BRAD|nr:hypothetical protein [Bradyrhizobium aeschynomenes]NPU65376.1 hypothetical protein [Bradyrhizobium aeschynomenes]